MIAIFAGTGDYPKEIIYSLKKNNKKFIIINITEKRLNNSFKFQLGQFGKILKFLKDYKDTTIIPADKGKCLVIMDKEQYVAETQKLLEDKATYKPLDPTKIKRKHTKKVESN